MNSRISPRLPRRLTAKILISGFAVSPIVMSMGTTAQAAVSVSAVQGLTTGSSGEAVTALQEALISRGIAVKGGADGHFGPMTLSALHQFQRSVGLPETSVVDEATAVAIGTEVSPMTGLRYGAISAEVKALQEALIAVGFPPKGGADGEFGRATESALKAFQSSVGIAATGSVDEVTAGHLAGAVSPAPASSNGTPSSVQPAAIDSSLVGLKYGDWGQKVTKLQKLILATGAALKGGADGSFGRVTEAALREFQNANGLAVTGTSTDETIVALSAAAPVSSDTSASTVPAVAVPEEFSKLVGLRPGALGDSVAALQRRLLDLGITVRGGADGIFGPATDNAVKAFQTARGLEATGIVDDTTATQLASDAAPASTAPSPAVGSTVGYGVYGETSERVAALQRALIDHGINVRGGADGEFGSATSAAVIAFQKREGLRVTGVVNDATANALGLNSSVAPADSPVATVSLAVFPVQGMCGFSDTWHAARSGGRLHVGVDIIAATGKYLYAVADGTISKVYVDKPGSLSGNAITLSQADGTYFFYAHLDTIAEGIEVGATVKAGQIIGTVGMTGNAGTPHLHFEVHPNGGAAVNPYPIVKAIDGCAMTEPPVVAQ